MRLIPAFAAACLLAGCSASQTEAVDSTVTLSLATAQADLTKAVSVYQIGKGLALVAEIANPTIAPDVMGITAVVDPLVAQAQTLLADATADAPAVESLAQTILAQATSLTVTAAPSIKAVPAS
jgi:hypothetical protein